MRKWIIGTSLFALITVTIASSFALHKTGPRPGKFNPFLSPQKWTMFHDDEAALFVHDGNGTIAPSSLWMDEDRHIHSAAHDPIGDFHFINHSHNQDRIPMDSGRLTQDRDSVVRAYLYNDSTVRLDVLSKNTDDVLIVENSINVNVPEHVEWRTIVDVSVADLILEIDDNSEHHDEIALALFYQNNNKEFKLILNLYDYELNLIDSIEDFSFDPPEGSCADPYGASGVHIEKGDFDGDDLLEVVVVADYIGGCADSRIRIAAFEYDHHNEDFVQLGHVYGWVQHGIGYLTFDAAAGDFDYDGKDELAVYDHNISIYSYNDNGDDKFHLSAHHDAGTSAELYNPRMIAGQFKFDPEHNYPLTVSQLAVVYENSESNASSLAINYYEVDGEQVHLRSILSVDEYTPKRTSEEFSYSNFDAAAGNFYVESGNTASPKMELMVFFCRTSNYFNTITHTSVVTFFEVANENTIEQVGSYVLGNGSETSHFSCIPYDRDGDALYLGAPVHVEVSDILSLNAIIQEPPKHVDYLPVNPTDWDGEWEVINVNAYPEFVVKFSDKEETAVKSKSSSVSSYTNGGGLSPFAETSFKTTLGPLNGAFSVGVKSKFMWNHSESTSEWNSSYNNLEQEIEFETNEDDILYGKIQDTDIWRYPVVNKTDDDGHYVYLDTTFPGPLSYFVGGGLVHDDYQPVHVNRNLLSYAAWTDEFPSDLGTFTLPDGHEEKKVMTDPLWLDYTGNAFNSNLSWSEAAGEGDSKTTTNTFNANVDIRLSYRGSAGVPEVEETESKFGVTLNAHHKGSELERKMGETEISDAKGVQIEVPELPKPAGDWYFRFFPAVYMARGGSVKAAHALDFDDGSLGAQWKHYYGGRPNLSLALPYRFHSIRDTRNEYVVWHLNEEYDRMAMRGFFIYFNEDDERKYFPGQSIEEGSVVELAARVYNFCLNNLSGPFTVRFECAVLDTSTDEEIDAPRILIGETDVEPLAPLEMREVSVHWDTTGFTLSNANHALRIYVTIDPDDRVQHEIHEWKDMEHAGIEGWSDETGRLYHGDNEGFYPPTGGYIVTAAANNSNQPLTAANQNILPVMQDISFHEESLSIKTDRGLLSSGEIRIPLGGRYKLRAHIQYADDHHPDKRYVVFYDDNPEHTDEVIGVKAVNGVNADTYVWHYWTPNEAGNYELWAVLLEHSDDPAPGNAKDKLHVTVYDPNAPTTIGEWSQYD